MLGRKRADTGSVESSEPSGVIPAVPHRTSFLNFVADIGDQQIGLTVHTPDQKWDASSGIDQALCLQTVEPQLVLLEDWLGVELDCRPGKADSASFAVVGVTRADSTGAKLMVHMSARSLGGLSGSAKSLIDSAPDYKFNWARHPAQIELARFQMGQKDLLAVGPGAVVLIPDSFNSVWNAAITVGELQMPGMLDSEKLVWCSQGELTNRSQPAAPDAPAVPAGDVVDALTTDEPTTDSSEMVELVALSRIAANQLLRANTETRFQLGNDTGQLRARLVLASGIQYTGVLAPVGTGHALFIDETEG